MSHADILFNHDPLFLPAPSSPASPYPIFLGNQFLPCCQEDQAELTHSPTPRVSL